MDVGDLGFRAVFLLVLLVFPAIGFFIRRKWLLAVARKKEIRLLLAMASEEAARAEYEAAKEYAVSSPAMFVNTVPTTVTPQRYCAVCYAPTTSRCRRCKSVRYCSSKCQVIHWRQGHKNECTPPLINNGSSDEGIKFASESVNKQNHHDDDLTSKSAEEESEYESDSSAVHAQNSPRKKNIGPNHVRDENVRVPTSSNAFVSSASPSSSAHKISNDFEDEKSLNLDASENVARGISHPVNNLGPFSDGKKLKEAKASSSASAIEIDHFVSGPGSANGESQCISTSPSDSDENLVPEPSGTASGFWDGCLDASITNKITQTGNAKTSYDGLYDTNGLGPGSLRRSPFDLNGGSLSDLHQKGSEHSNHTFAERQTSKLKKVATFSGKETRSSSSSSDPMLMTSKLPISIDREINNGSNDTKSKDVKPVSSRPSFDGSSIVESQSVAADNVKGRELYDQGRSKHTKESFQPSMSKMAKTPQKFAEGLSSSDANKHSTSALKPMQAGNDNRSVVHNQAPSILPMSKKVTQSRPSKLSRYYSFGVGSGPSAQSSEKGLFPYDLFVKLYNWKDLELRPCGLINCGNSCYANAVLQCLTFTPPLTAYLLEGFHSKTCSKKDWCYTCELERLILAVKKGAAPLSPISILSHIEKIGSHLATGREEDAHEFMRYSIETMQSICLQEARVSGAKSLEEETTLLGLTFGGYLRSKIRCMRCRGKSEQHERMMDLTVEIEGNIETLEEALRRFTGVEILDGENKYKCSRCKSYEKAKKRLTIFEAPNVLTIALKRFQAGKFGKLNKSIRFPDVLDLAPYMRGTSDKSPIYGLYGVIVHLDVMNATFSGHYICYVRNAQNNWFKIDDSMVKPVEMEGVLKEGAYMLFYSRYSPRAPRSVRDSMVPRDISKKSNPPDAKPPKDADVRKGFLRVGGGHPRSPNEPGFSPRAPYVQETESSSSDTSSLFSHSEGASSSTTDSNHESSSATTDEVLELQNHYNFLRHNQLDSDTSSSSSTSSSPLYMARPSPLSNTERYASAHSDLTGFDSEKANSQMDEVSVLQADNMKQCRKAVNSSSGNSSSSCRETDSAGKLVGWSNRSGHAKAGVYLR